MQIFAENLGVKVIRVNAESALPRALRGVTDPEEKRKIIGGLFIDVFDEEAHKLDGRRLPGAGHDLPGRHRVRRQQDRQGARHQVATTTWAACPRNMSMKLVEPLRELFKDEVRKLGVELGLPREMVYRHPFPGPGLGVRILGEVTQGLRRPAAPGGSHLHRRAAQATICTTRPARRSRCSCRCARWASWATAGATTTSSRLRAVETIDFMTAHWARLPYELLDVCSRRIVNEVQGISRVVYDISGKPPATIEWE